MVHRDCDNHGIFCPKNEKFCETSNRLQDNIACTSYCCNTDNCNNFTPGSASGIMVTKFTFILMVIVGLVA